MRQRRGRSKYGAIRTTVDGITFDSKREAERYQQLKMFQRAGLIANLELQPVFVILPKRVVNGRSERAITYRADFRYQTLDRKGNLVTVVEDVKGVRTDVYKLKKKLVEYLHKIEITEV